MPLRPSREEKVHLNSNLGARWGRLANVTPRPLYSRERKMAPILHDVWGTQDQSEHERKISPSLGCDPRNAQPVASRYTECAIAANIHVQHTCPTYMPNIHAQHACPTYMSNTGFNLPRIYYRLTIYFREY
jgi:hypothetical protein